MLLLSLDDNMMLQLRLALHEIRVVVVYRVFLEYLKVVVNTLVDREFLFRKLK
jgi:hypothetical protein